MKTIFLSVSLFFTLFAAANAHADWVRVEHAGKELSLYLDPDTREDSGHGTTKMWHLLDYPVAQEIDGKAFSSMKGQDEYDCAKGLSRELLHLWHRDAMGNSQMVNAAYVPTAWLAPESGSVGQTLLQLACKAK